MTGIYFSVLRNGKWENVEVEHLTKEERRRVFLHESTERIFLVVDRLCEIVADVDGALSGQKEGERSGPQVDPKTLPPLTGTGGGGG